MTNRDVLDEMLLKGKITQQEGFNYFDKLSSVDIGELKGEWMARELSSGHPLDQVLKASNWYGKFISDSENVFPLLFKEKNGKLYGINPGLLPLKLAEKLPFYLIKVIFKICSPFIRTKKSKARLRMVHYRKKDTAALIYDQKPIMDMFGRVDEKTILGVSDVKWEHDIGCFFVLESVESSLKEEYK